MTRTKVFASGLVVLAIASVISILLFFAIATNSNSPYPNAKHLKTNRGGGPVAPIGYFIFQASSYITPDSRREVENWYDANWIDYSQAFYWFDYRVSIYIDTKYTFAQYGQEVHIYHGHSFSFSIDP